MKSEVTTVTMPGNLGAILVWLYRKKDGGHWRRFLPCFMLSGSRRKTLQTLYCRPPPGHKERLSLKTSARHWMLKQSLNLMMEARSGKVTFLRLQRWSPSKHVLITQQAPIWVLTTSAIFCILFDFVTQGFYMESFILEQVYLEVGPSERFLDHWGHSPRGH